MRRLPEKRQSLHPPAGIVPLLIAAGFVLVVLAVVMVIAGTR